ncbi:type VII secretion protein EssB [Weissella confusa]|uniref:type VII secretion protein EssB n=1 Tax=Weissella confusa TaxID=1583 RepID=UPI001C6FACDB|nr:type VII secretion protein EssB [Weissella confusa]QYU58613.1 type VII secretion protein EssB [Weissella confusa]
MGSFKIDNLVIEPIETEDGVVTITLPRSVFIDDDVAEIELLRQPKPVFIEQELEADVDSITFKYQLPAGSGSLDTATTFSLSDKLRLIQKMLELKDLAETKFTTMLDPENLRLSSAHELEILYRGAQDVLPPIAFDSAELLLQIKALAIFVLENKQSFNDLYIAKVQNVSGGKLAKEIAASDSFESLATIVGDALTEAKKVEARKYRTVTRVKYRVYQQMAIWGTGIALASLAVVGYWQFSVAPFQDHLSDATTSFLKKDYTGVTKNLATVSEGKLPTTQRYELAYSYVQNAALSNKQQEAVLNNISLNSDTNYLNFWIEVGRGQLAKALDTAKATEDNDLILYAITQQMSKIKNDPSVSGATREKRLAELQKDYDTYYKKRTEALTGSASSSATN